MGRFGDDTGDGGHVRSADLHGVRGQKHDAPRPLFPGKFGKARQPFRPRREIAHHDLLLAELQHRQRPLAQVEVDLSPGHKGEIQVVGTALGADDDREDILHGHKHAQRRKHWAKHLIVRPKGLVVFPFGMGDEVLQRTDIFAHKTPSAQYLTSRTPASTSSCTRVTTSGFNVLFSRSRIGSSPCRMTTTALCSFARVSSGISSG